MSVIEVKIIHKEPTRKDFEELSQDPEAPAYVAFDFDNKDYLNLHTDYPERQCIIILSDDKFINWNNVAIPRCLYYELSLLHFKNYKRVLAHYLALQKNIPVYRESLKTQVDNVVIDPYFEYLLNLRPVSEFF